MAKLTQEEFDALSVEEQDKVPFSDLPIDDFEDESSEPKQDSHEDEDDLGDDEDNGDEDEEDDSDSDTDTDEDSDSDSDNEDEDDEGAEQDHVKRALDVLAKDTPKQDKSDAKDKQSPVTKDAPRKAVAPAIDPILREAYKINGKDVKIEDPKEIRRMVSRGIHLESRIAAMHDNAQVGAAIAKAGVKAEDIGLLIDILAKKPEAIAKVVKDSGLDINSLYDDEEKEYKPSALPLPSDVESKFTLHTTVHGHDENYMFALNEANEWDAESQSIILQNPNVLNILAQHKADGTFDEISEVVTRKRTLEGDTRPVIAVYDEVGRALYAQKQQQQKAAPKTVNTGNAAKPKLPKRTRIVDADLERKRKIVQGARGKTKNKARQDVDALSVSDIQSMSQEDFESIDPNKFFELN